MTEMAACVSKREINCLTRVYPEAEGCILICCRWEALIAGEDIS